MPEILKKKLPLIIVAVIFVVLVGVFVWKSNIKESQFDWSSADKLNLNSNDQVKYEESVKKLETAKDDPSALINLARLRNSGGDPEGAIKLYQEALKLRPTDTLILNNLGDIYYSIGDYIKSEEMYLAIVKNNPKWVNAYYTLVEIYRYKLKDKYSQVPDLLLKGLAASPETAGSFYAMLAVYYQDVGDKANAIEYYQKTLEKDPQNGGAAAALKELQNQI